MSGIMTQTLPESSGNRILFLDNIRVCSSIDTLFKKDLTIVSYQDTKFPNSIS